MRALKVILLAFFFCFKFDNRKGKQVVISKTITDSGHNWNELGPTVQRYGS